MKKEHEQFSSYVEIDLDNLAHNLGVIRSKISGGTDVLAVVKADAYNHGAEVVSDKLYRCGVRHFAVANIDEALHLRNSGIGGMVLVLGPMLPSRYDDASEKNISVTIDSHDSLLQLAEYTKFTGNDIKIHIALNTGMNRIGFRADGEVLSEELRSVCGIIKENPHIIPEGVFSHFADADNNDPEFTTLQYDRFAKTVCGFEKEGIALSFRHICNSTGALKYVDYHCDLVRYGIGLYGCELSGEDLRPVMSFKTHIAQILNVKKEEGIGYGLAFKARRDMRIATITAGYADGFNRLLSNRGSVLVRGRRAPVVGRICMDMAMIDVTDIAEAELYDEVTILGSDGSETITAEEHAHLCGTISYEILCRIGKRVNRVYIENGMVVQQKNT